MTIKTFKNICWLINIVLALSGCTTTYHITTTPVGSDVYNSQDKLIGKTPLDLKETDIPKDKDGKGILLRLEHKGYKRLWVWFPRNTKEYKVDINLAFLYPLKYQKSDEPKTIAVKRGNLSLVSDKILDIQDKLLSAQKVDDKSISDILADNPTMGSLYYLEGVNFLIQNKQKEALASLRKAVLYSPEEEDYQTLLNEVLEAGGGSKNGKNP